MGTNGCPVFVDDSCIRAKEKGVPKAAWVFDHRFHFAECCSGR
jgi:hypothetical protein